MSPLLRRSSVAPVLLLHVLGIALLFTGARPVVTNDLHIYLAMGRWMAEHGALLEREVFTWTVAGTPFVNGTWGFSLHAWGLYRLAGLDGLRLVNGAAVALAVLATAGAARSWGADARMAAVSGLYAWLLLFQNTVVRGQTLCFALLALLLWVVARGRPWRSLLAGLGIGALWASLHGSFPAGIAVLGLVGLGQLLDGAPPRRAAPALLAALGLGLGACIGPYGPGIWLYVLDNSALPRERGFVEWAPADPRSFAGARFFLALLLWVGLALRGPRRWEQLLPLLAFALLGLSGTRFIAWFGLATAPALALALSARRAPDPGLPGARLLLAGSALLWLAFLVRGLAPRPQPLHPDTPVALVDALERAPDCSRLFNPPEYGGYLAFRLPEARISHDVRTWLYDDEAWAIYTELSAAPPGWEQRLEAAGVRCLLLLDAFHAGSLLPAARASGAWRELAADERGAVFIRQD